MIQELGLPNSEISYWPHFLNKEVANRYFKCLLRGTPWQQDDITLFGKTHPQSRLTALYGDNGREYSYSGITMQPIPFSRELLEIKEKVEIKVLATFTSCLLNLYRDGMDSNGWHSDDERELGKNPIIASISLGAERPFCFRHRKDKGLRHKMILQHGSLLLMGGETQHCWQHQLPKTKKKIGSRINMTFRYIS